MGRRPFDCKNTDDCCELRRDSFDAGDFWILTDGFNVSIHEQKLGEHSKQTISVPRAEFNRLIRWYMREQKPNPRNRP